MSENSKKAAALTAAISMLGLSLGVSAPADAQYAPVRPGAQPGTQGVLIGLNQPSSQQYKSEQWKSEQLKSEQLKSQQFKSQQFKSQQLKMQSNQVKLAPQP
ncbi:MAG: hypothetical protein ABI471_09495 [Sphingomonas bacterium]